MATTTVTLSPGLKVGEIDHTLAELREATAGDHIEATEESEKVIATPEGFQLLASPTLVGLNTLRRQVVRIGDYRGPLSLAELKKLSAHDLSLLQEAAMALESASLKEFAERGRD